MRALLRNPRKRRLARLSVWAAVGVVGLAVPAAGSPAEGFKLSDSNTQVRREYPPLAAPNPSGAALAVTLSDCQTFPSDAAIPVELETRHRLHVTVIRVTWANRESNDVDIFFFDETGGDLGSSTSSNQFETLRLGNLDNGLYYLCVRNATGVNTGFVVEASLRLASAYTRPPETPDPSTPAPTEAPEATPRPTPDDVGTQDISETAEPVRTPGADGPFAEKGLVTVAAGRQAARDEGGLSTTQIVLFALTGLIAAGGAGIVALRIRRDLRG